MTGSSLNSKGQILLMSLVICGLSGVLLFVWMSQFRLIQQMEQKDSVVAAVELIRERVRLIILDRLAWNNMVAYSENTSLGCLKEGSDCTGQSGGISLVDSQNSVLASPGSQDGFSLAGEICRATPESNCEVVPRLFWRALCTGVPPCLDPLVEVTMTISYFGADVPGSLNFERLGFKLVRQNQFQSTFKSVSKTLGSIGICPAGSVANGHLSDGSVSCIRAP